MTLPIVRIGVVSVSFIFRTASTASPRTSLEFAHDKGSASVLEKTTFDRAAKGSVPGSACSENPDMRRYVVAPIRTV